MLVLRVTTTSGTTTLTGRSALIIASGSSDITISGTKESISFSQQIVDYDTWYYDVVHRKQVAMFTGGSSASALANGNYGFERGINTYIYGKYFTPYLKTLQETPPDANRNIQLLPGKTVDVVSYFDKHKIALKRLLTGIKRNTGVILRELNALAWYLYHAFNAQAYRLHKFAPDVLCKPMFTSSRLWGTIPSLQSLIARWNYLVWKRSFLFNISQSRETLSFSVGYVTVDCTIPSVKIHVDIINTGISSGDEDTTPFLTLYSQGISTDLEKTPKVSLEKSNSNGDVIQIDGHGTDEWAKNKLPWKMMTIDIYLENLAQNNFYNEAFSVAVALNETTAMYYQQYNEKTHTLEINTSWTITDANGTERTYEDTKTVEILSILLNPEEEIDDEEGGLI